MIDKSTAAMEQSESPEGSNHGLRESEERQRFLLKLSDTLRPIADAAEIQATTTRLLGTHLRVDRSMYAQVDGSPGEEIGTIQGQYVRTAGPGEPPIAQFPEHFAYRPFGGGIMADRYDGSGLVVSDVDADPAFSAEERDAWAAAGVRAAIVAPLVKDGRLVAELGVQSTMPRAWTEAEVSLVRDVAERTWAAAGRARAEAALAASEEKYRSLFETMGQGYCELELLRDRGGIAVDQLYIELNPAFERLFGVPVAEAQGRKASEVFPDLEPEWTETFDSVARSGLHARVEQPVGDRWFEVFAYSRGGDRLAVMYEEVTDRKRAEIALRQSEERKAFLLKLSDAMRTESAVDCKIAVAARLLGEKLGASRVLYAEYDHKEGVAHMFNGWLADGAQPFPPVLKLEDFEGEVLNDLRAGRVVRVDDVGRLSKESGYAAIASVGVQALLSPPLLIDGQLKFNISIHQHEPRHWTDDEVALVQEVSERLWAEIERARTERALRDRDERLRVIVESARDYAIFTTTGDRTIREWLPGAEAVFGYSREEAEGQSADMLFTAEDRARGEPEKEAEGAGRDGMAPDVRWHVRKGGEPVFIDGQVVPLRDGGGEEGFLKIGQDVTVRRAAEERLRESEERFRQFGEASSDLLWIRDARTLAFEYVSPSFQRLYGVPRDQVLERNNMETWLEIIHPDDRKHAVEALTELRAGVPSKHTFRVIHPDGEVRWIENTDFPMTGNEGTVERIAGIAQDVTERRRAVEMQEVLLAELQHRVRNTLAVVRSIASRTAENSTSAEQMLNHFVGRLDSFSRVQAAVTRSAGGGVDLASLIEDEMVAHAAREGDQLRIEGPEVTLDASTAERMSLAIHELTTNAVKHGALTTERGCIRISWSCKRAEEGRERLLFRWEESGLDCPPHADSHGFGMELLQRSLPYDLEAQTEVKLRPNGLLFTLDLPLKRPRS